MKVKVNKDACIGCGACAAICDAIFEIDDDGLSVVKKEEVDEENKQAVIDSKESCPTGAIETTEEQ